MSFLSREFVDIKTPFSVKQYGAIGDGAANDLAAIQATFTAASSSGGTVYFPHGTYLITSNTTLGTTGQVIYFEAGALLKPTGSKTITINCFIKAENNQHIFDRSAGGIILFGVTGPQKTTPEHFGAARDNTTDDQLAIQAAHDALVTYGGDLQLLRGRYALSSGLVLKTGVNIRTAGSGGNGIGTLLIPKTSMTVLSWSATGAPQKRTTIEPLTIAFSSIPNTISDGHNSNICIDLSNVLWAVIEEPTFIAEGSSSQGATGLFFGGSATGPYWNIIRGILFFGTAGANCIPAHFASLGTFSTNANFVEFQSISFALCIAWFGAAAENTVHVIDAESIDTGSSYWIFGDEPVGPSGSLGNRCIMNYYESTGVYMARFGSVTTANDRNVIECIDNGEGSSPLAFIDPAGNDLETNQILTQSTTGAETFADPVLRSGGAFRHKLTQASTSDHTTTVPNVTATLTARDPGVHVVSTTGGTTTLSAMSDIPENVIIVNGVLTSDATIEVPARAGFEFAIQTNATGPHAVKVKAIGGTAVTVYAVATFFVANDGVSLVKKTIDTSDNNAGQTTLVAGSVMSLDANSIVLNSSANVTGGTIDTTVANFLTVTANTGINLLSLTGGSAIGFAADTINIGNSASQLGGDIKATGTGTLQFDALTKIEAKINGNSRIFLDGYGVNVPNLSPSQFVATDGDNYLISVSTIPSVGIDATSGEAISAGAPIGYENVAGSPRVFNADSNAGGNRHFCAGIANTTVGSSGLAINIYASGERAIPDAIWDSIPATTDVGSLVFISETAGKLTLTAPTTSGSYVQKVGIVTVGGSGFVKIAIQLGDSFIN